ncbi:MAG: ribosome maturation factor RimP [Alphaproteobacteria bacterium]
MSLPERVERMIAPSLAEMGYEVVRVRAYGSGRLTLQVMAERTDQRAMALDDCTRISRTISALLDVEDPIAGSYVLEVSSPGVDRPLVRPKDFERFVGCEARLETKSPINGRRRFRGRLVGVTAEGVRVALEDGEVELPLGGIETARLVSQGSAPGSDVHRGRT